MMNLCNRLVQLWILDQFMNSYGGLLLTDQKKLIEPWPNAQMCRPDLLCTTDKTGV